MPAVPGDAGTLEHVLHLPLIASVQVRSGTHSSPQMRPPPTNILRWIPRVSPKTSRAICGAKDYRQSRSRQEQIYKIANFLGAREFFVSPPNFPRGTLRARSLLRLGPTLEARLAFRGVTGDESIGQETAFSVSTFLIFTVRQQSPTG